MSMTHGRQHRLGGYMFGALSLVLLASAVAAAVRGVAAQAVAGVLLSGFLGYLAWGQFREDRQPLTAPAEDRPNRRIERAAAESFWLLVSVIVLQSVFGFLPREFVSQAYVLAGLAVFGLFLAYFSWRGTS